jgi:hypothetical protein
MENTETRTIAKGLLTFYMTIKNRHYSLFVSYEISLNM